MILSTSAWGMLGIAYLLIWYLITGIFLYISICEIIKFSKKNSVTVKGEVDHIVCSVMYRNTEIRGCDGETVKLDRVPDKQSEIPVSRYSLKGKYMFYSVYKYMWNGEQKTLCDSMRHSHGSFDRKRFYKGAPVTIRVSKQDNDAYAEESKGLSFSMKMSIVFAIFGIAQTIGFIALMINGIWTFI